MMCCGRLPTWVVFERVFAVVVKLIAYPAIALCALAAPVAYVQIKARSSCCGGLVSAISNFSVTQVPPGRRDVRWAVESLPGTIVMAGGTFIDEMGQEVVRLAGGEKARVVLIPTAYGPTEEEGVEQFYELWGKYKPAKIDVLHTRDRAVANDPEFVRPLKEATAVWFLGGVQTRLLDTYENTLLLREVRGVFERGGVVGGNCAGAMALGETMIVCGEEDEDDEDVVVRPGFGIVPKMVADSHVLERNRVERLRGVIEEHPDHFAIGIDAATAVIIEHGKLRFLGNSYVTTLVPTDAKGDVRFDVWRGKSEVDLGELFARGRTE